MAEWWTARRISDSFAVSESKLERFSQRGNLPSWVDAEGIRYFDLESVEQLFPPRGSPLLARRPTSDFGVVGAMRLGVPGAETDRSISSLPTRVKREPAPRELLSAVGS